MGDLSNHVFAHGLVLEDVALGPRPKDPASELVQVRIHLLQVVSEALGKSTMRRYKESSLPLVTSLLTSGVGDLVAVVIPHYLLQTQVHALLQAKPPKEGENRNGLPHQPVG